MKATIGTIKPDDIEVGLRPFTVEGKTLKPSFGTQERGSVAEKIVLFCQDRGHWGDFYYHELNQFVIDYLPYRVVVGISKENVDDIADSDGTWGILINGRKGGTKKNPYRIDAKFARIYHLACPKDTDKKAERIEALVKHLVPEVLT